MGFPSYPTLLPPHHKCKVVNSHQVGGGIERCERFLCRYVIFALGVTVIIFPSHRRQHRERSGLEDVERGGGIKDLWLSWQQPERRLTPSPTNLSLIDMHPPTQASPSLIISWDITFYRSKIRSRHPRDWGRTSICVSLLSCCFICRRTEQLVHLFTVISCTSDSFVI